MKKLKLVAKIIAVIIICLIGFVGVYGINHYKWIIR